VAARAARFLLLGAAALALAACGRFAHLGVALAYANATALITWTVDDYVDLDRAQKEQVRSEVARAMAWHRAVELPGYGRFLASISERAGRPFSEAEVAQAWDEVRAAYVRVVERVLPEASAFLASLDERQLAHLERRFDEDNRKFVRESTKGTPQERRAEAVKRNVARIEDWTGRLSPPQRAIVAAREEALPTIEERLADRRYRQSETLALARTRDPARIAAGLRRLLIDTDSWRRPEYRAKLGARDAATFLMIARLSATLTPEQRSHLRRRIQGYTQDIARLASSG